MIYDYLYFIIFTEYLLLININCYKMIIKKFSTRLQCFNTSNKFYHLKSDAIAVNMALFICDILTIILMKSEDLSPVLILHSLAH